MNDPLAQLGAEIANAPEPPGAQPGNGGDGPPPPDWMDTDGPPERGRGRGEIWHGCKVIPLGVDGDISYYIDALGQLRAIDNHSLDKMRHVFCGEVQSLARRFPQYDQNGKPKPGKFEQAALAAAMTSSAAECGVWKPVGKVRGPGCWCDDDGGLIIHAGDEILIGGKWRKPGLHEGKVYTAGDPVPRPAETLPRYDAGQELLHLLETWAWRRPEIDPYLVLGVVMAQMLGGALEWRPVTWLTGSAATGKSTFQKLLSHIHGGDCGLLQAADATESGIRSILGYSSLPVAIDELEPDGDRPQKVRGVIELARRAASGSQIFRGSADQKGYQANAFSCFLFSSIYVPDMPSQDRSRMIILELDQLASDLPAPRLDPRKLRRIGQVLRRRIMDAWSEWPARLDAWLEALAEEGQAGRSGRNFATALALADIALNDELAAADVRASWAAKISKQITDASMEIGDDVQDMMLHLMGQMIDPFRRGEQFSIAQWVMAAAELKGAPAGIGGDDDDTPWDKSQKARRANEQLSKYGLRVATGDGVPKLFLPNAKIPALCKLFEGSTWGNGVWSQSARRFPGATPSNPLKLAGIQTRGTYIPVTAIPGLSDFQTTQTVAPSAPHVTSENPLQNPPYDPEDF